MSTHPPKRALSLQSGEDDSNKKQRSLFSSVDASVHDHSRGTTNIVFGNNNSFHHGPTLTQNIHGATDDLIQKLTRSHNAEYDMRVASSARGPCTPDTRTVVLQKLLEWCNSDAALLYWLSGMAGTGKTTIAYTVCQKLAQANILGASFFCSRSLPDCRDVKLIIPTIAFQLSRRFEPFSEALTYALREDEYILKRDLDVQLRRLIIEPWKARKNDLPDNATVVVDALDECDEDHAEFLQVISDHATLLPFKLLMTSRPEPSIRDIMVEKAQASGTLSTFILHEVESDLVQQDIAKYLTSQLSSRTGPDDIEFLTLLAGTLFIFAATLVRFLTARKVNIITRIKLLRTSLPPDTKLKMLSSLDELYKGVLKAAFHDDLMELEVRQMREILFTVICAREPLTKRAIASLWNLTEEEVDERLDALRSVISVPDDDYRPITVFHASFPDFMEDPVRSGHFCCHPHASNLELVQRCLLLVKSELRQNPCQLIGRPPNNTIDPGVIHKHIPSGLRYACVYWAEHWTMSDHSERQVVSNSIYCFLTTDVLHWFECLSLIGRLEVGIQTLETLMDALAENADLVTLVHDYLRFIQYFYDYIKSNAMQTYYYALTWTPSQSLLHTHYVSLCKQAPQVLCGLPATWTGPDQAINIHTDEVRSIAISRDGRSIASGSSDRTVRIWNVRSHVEECVLSGHAFHINSVAISGDGSHAISGSYDRSLRVWNIVKRKAAFTLEPDSEILSVAISSDDKWIASGHRDDVVRVWDSTDGRLIHSLQEHTSNIRSVAFTYDDARLVSGSSDRTARIWNVVTGETECILRGHTAWVMAVACSPNDDKIATGSRDRSVRLWNASGEELHILRAHSRPACCVLFMPDGKRIVSGSEDGTLRVWDVTSGDMIHVFTGLAGGVQSVAVFPDGLKMAACAGKTIFLWSLRGGDAIGGEKKDDHSSTPIVTARSMAFSSSAHRVLLLPSLRIVDTTTLEEKVVLDNTDDEHKYGAFSASGSRVAASTRDLVIKIWELRGDSVLADPLALKGHTALITSLSFSHDEHQLLSSSNDCSARVWDATTGKQIHFLKHPHSVFSAKFSHDNGRIVSATYYTTASIHIWSAQSGEELYQFSTLLQTIVFSPDDQHFITSLDNTINIYNAKTFQLEHAYKGYKYWTMMDDGSSYAVSDDGWICHFPNPCVDEPHQLLQIPSQYRPTLTTNIGKTELSGPLFILTSRGIQVYLPREDGLITLVIPRSI